MQKTPLPLSKYTTSLICLSLSLSLSLFFKHRISINLFTLPLCLYFTLCINSLLSLCFLLFTDLFCFYTHNCLWFVLSFSAYWTQPLLPFYILTLKIVVIKHPTIDNKLFGGRGEEKTICVKINLYLNIYIRGKIDFLIS